MNRYYAFQIWDDSDGIDLYASTDAALMHRELAEQLGRITEYGGRIETIEVGCVEAESVDKVLNAIRAGKWLAKSHGRAEGKENTAD